ncbi:MAG: F0F1 ATP synthase subunit A [Saprospiraceae bacterium]|nr:F0F1 ATP synthase subunit A [Saprospiraceae bacterium]
MIGIRKFWIALIFSGLSTAVLAQHETPPTSQSHPTESHTPPANAETAHSDADSHGDCGHPIDEKKPGEFNAGENAVHHISDANVINIIGDLYFHLPVILQSEKGWMFSMSSAFHPHHHGNGENSHNGYVLVHGSVMRLKDAAFENGDFKVAQYTHKEVEGEGGKKKTQYHAVIDGKCVPLEAKTTYDGGILGGGVTSFKDFSVTRNVFTMLLTTLILFLVFRSVANTATRRTGQAPKGLQNFIEPFYTFIRDEVAKPNIGPKYEKYMPYLLSAFFFILGLNLIGQIPFFPGSANVTGNISITIVLALITFLISTFSANKHFWEHTLWMPGVPAVLKILILTPIEILGLFLKPFTLLLRLFANITAGHIVILSFVSLIFILGKVGTSTGGAFAGIAASIPLTLFMMALELLVAFLQAFIFTMLSATYIGTAIEEGHHAEEHH